VPIDRAAILTILSKIHLFHDLKEEELAAIADKLQEASYPAGSVIFQQGQKPDSFYLIHEGTIRIVQRYKRQDIQLALLVKDDYFGELGLIAKRSRSATATALTDSSLLVMSRQDFQKFYKNIPQLRLNFDLAVRGRNLARKLQFNWLRPDEVIYFLARKHPIVLYLRLIWPLLGLFVPLFFFYAWFTIASSWIVAIAGFLSLIGIVLWAIWYILDWRNDYYIVTNHRVVWLEKVIAIYESRQESPLNTILSVAVQTTWLGRILDYGDVIVRTWVGRVPFNEVSHPEQAQHMIEEYWERTKEQAVGIEKEEMKDALRRHMGIPVPPKPPPVIPVEKAPEPKKERRSLLRFLGSGTLRLRYETGESVFYRKHWFVLIQQALLPLLGIIAAFIVFGWRQVLLFSRLRKLFSNLLMER
jgi:hypothetical protein